MQRSDRARARWRAAFPILVLVFASTFYLGLFKAWNSTSALPAGSAVAGSGEAFDSAVDVCRASASKIQVEAWVALKGHARRKHESLLLVRDPGTGEYLRMKTRVVLRPDVSRFLNEKYGDRVDYSGTGLRGSLNLEKGGRAIPHGQVYAGYDTGRGLTLVELPCAF